MEVGARQDPRVAEGSIVLELENVSPKRRSPVNIYTANVSERVDGAVTRVVCHGWDSQKPMKLIHVDRHHRRAAFDFRRTFEAAHPFAGTCVDGSWRAERAVASTRMNPLPVHPEIVLVTVYYELP